MLFSPHPVLSSDIHDFGSLDTTRRERMWGQRDGGNIKLKIICRKRRPSLEPRDFTCEGKFRSPSPLSSDLRELGKRKRIRNK